jgi:hypothetical protein
MNFTWFYYIKFHKNNEAQEDLLLICRQILECISPCYLELPTYEQGWGRGIYALTHVFLIPLFEAL